MFMSPLERNALMARSPKEFYRMMKIEGSPITPEQVVSVLKTSGNIASGLLNSVYGDVAIPVVFVGASGVWGNQVRHNIYWALGVIYDMLFNHPKLTAKSMPIIINHLLLEGLYHHSFCLVNYMKL